VKIGTLQNVLAVGLDEIFPLAASLGFDGVEIDWNAAVEAQPGGPLAPERRPAIRTAAQAAGVAIPSVAAHFLNGGGIADRDPAVQRAGMDALRAGIRLCADLGATVLLTPFFAGGDIGGADGVARLEANLRTLAPEAEAAGVIIAIEHTLSAADCAALLDRIASPAVKTYWDMANGMALNYDPVADVMLLGPRIAQVHAKEFVRDDGPAGTRAAPRFDKLNAVPFGHGDVPAAAIIAALKQHGYDGYIVLETGSFGDPPGAARAALARLQTYTATPQEFA
jgi:sugar phosphate isomerase/epimerase